MTFILDSSFAVDLSEPVRLYERLFYAGLTRDWQLFALEDDIEETWHCCQTTRAKPPEPLRLLGTEAAQLLLHGHRS